MGSKTPITQAACSQRKAMHRSAVAYAYYDAADRLRSWNPAYEDLNVAIRPLIRENAYFPDLLVALIAANQVDMCGEPKDSWIATRLKQRRYGSTAVRNLNKGRTFLVQERKDDVGGTSAFLFDISEMIRAGARMTAHTTMTGADPPLADPGPQVRIRSQLQTVLGNLELLQLSVTADEPSRLVQEALDAGLAIAAVVDQERSHA